MAITLTRSRAAAIIACAAMMALAVGCGDEEVGDSSRSVDTNIDGTAVEDAYIVPTAAPASCAVEVGDVAEIKFTATNNRHNEPERLMSISTAIAEAVQIIPGPGVPIPAGMSISAGQPIEQPAPQRTPDQPLTVTLQAVKETVEPGTSVPVIFQFEKSGDLTMDVPVEACPTQGG
jgi:copper(I)-binding protein